MSEVPRHEEDPDEIEMNRLAYEALYPEEREQDCPECGRRREIIWGSEGTLYRCLSCEDQIYSDDMDEDDDL